MISKNASRFYRQGELHLIENYEEAVKSPESIEKQKRSAAEYFKNRRLKNGNAKET